MPIFKQRFVEWLKCCRLLRMLPIEMQVKHTDRKIHTRCMFQYVSFSTSIKMVKEMQRLFDVSEFVCACKTVMQIDGEKKKIDNGKWRTLITNKYTIHRYSVA